MNINCESLIQTLNEAIISLDKDGYILYCNPATTAITGFTPEELINKPLSVFYKDREDAIRMEYELSMAQKNKHFISEGWKSKKAGGFFWGELSIYAISDEKNTRKGYTCLLRDTTERKNRELELRHSEERFRFIVESVKDYAIFMLDKDGNIATWNDGAKRIKGYHAHEIIGKHFSTFYTAEDLKDNKPERELKVAVATGKYEEEGWRVRKNGSLFWANVVITALFNEQNKLIGFSKVTRDLTERKETEEALRQSEERYRSLVEQVTDYGIFMMDEKGRIISWNEGAKRINGYTAEEIIGKYFSIFYPEEDLIKGKPSYELKVAREKGKYEEEGWRIKKDGTKFWASIVITAVYNNNALIGFSKVARDLTERKESEKALRQSYEQYRLLTEELRITNSELSYANQELEQFTSIVSHDLQEPIRTIKSFLQLIDMKLDEEQNDELKKYIDKAIGAAGRMRELIQNLLHYSQLGKTEIVEQEVDVHQLINEALQNVKTSIEKNNAQIHVATEVDKVHGDPVQLLQLLQNLLSNALKFTNQADPQITIKAYNENGHTKFAVSDNGIGIDKSDFHKVFEIFRRLNAKKEYPGTGIGLAICKKIVDRHGGTIWPESQVGQGTTFYFTLNEKPKETVAVS